MKPTIELLEPRCVLSATLPDPGTMPVLSVHPVAGIVHEAIAYDLSDGTTNAPWVTMPPEGAWAWSGDLTWPWAEDRDYWHVAAALTQPPMSGPEFAWPEVIGGGQWDVFHAHYAAGDSMNAQWMTLQRLEMPSAESVGLLLHADGSVTVYQQTPGVLWCIDIHGTTPGQWAQVASLADLPEPSVPATGPIPLGWLVAMDPVPEDWQWGDPLPAARPAVVYGEIFATEGEVRVGLDRFVVVVRGSAVTVEAVDEFWMQGEWQPEAVVWGAV